MPTTVEVLADAIKDAGTPFIVGHPGGESVDLMDAARQRDMRFVLMKQEVAGWSQPRARTPTRRNVSLDARSWRHQHGE